MVNEIKETEFNNVISAGKVVVDCFAEWCGPCKMLGPVIEDLANELTDYKFYKLNVDDAYEITSKYGIMSIPTVLIFENGELKNKSVGFKTKSELKELL